MARPPVVKEGASSRREGPFVAGRLDHALELFAALAAQPGRVNLPGLCGLLTFLPAAGRVEEAVAIAEETVTAARVGPNPCFVAFARYGYGRAFAHTDPSRALRVLREGLAYAREQRLLFWEANIAQEAAGVEAVHGQLDEALSMFDTAIDSFHRAGNVALLAETLAKLAMSFDRIERPEIAATIYGAAANYAGIHAVINLAGAVAHLRALLGDVSFGECAAAAADMELADAVATPDTRSNLPASNPKAQTGTFGNR